MHVLSVDKNESLICKFHVVDRHEDIATGSHKWIDKTCTAIRLAQSLTLWPLTNVAWIRSPTLEREIVYGH